MLFSRILLSTAILGLVVQPAVFSSHPAEAAQLMGMDARVAGRILNAIETGINTYPVTRLREYAGISRAVVAAITDRNTGRVTGFWVTPSGEGAPFRILLGQQGLATQVHFAGTGHSLDLGAVTAAFGAEAPQVLNPIQKSGADVREALAAAQEWAHSPRTAQAVRNFIVQAQNDLRSVHNGIPVQFEILALIVLVAALCVFLYSAVDVAVVGLAVVVIFVGMKIVYRSVGGRLGT